MEKNLGENNLVRLAVCAAAAIAVVYAGETLCRGKNWQKYGPWLRENRLQAAVILTAALYWGSQALWPGEKTQECGAGYIPCP